MTEINNMIAINTKSKDSLDFIETPIEVLNGLYPHFVKKLGLGLFENLWFTESRWVGRRMMICDFSCGNGAILKYFSNRDFFFNLFGSDIEDRDVLVESITSSSLKKINLRYDYLNPNFYQWFKNHNLDYQNSLFKVVIMNPPYNKVSEFIAKSLINMKNDKKIKATYLLCNLNALCSQQRIKIFNEHGKPTTIIFFGKRLQFIEGKSSNINNAWLCWDRKDMKRNNKHKTTLEFI